MDKVLAMSDIHPRDRVAYWRDVASHAIVSHECRVSTPSAFDATVFRAPLGELSVMSIESLGLECVEHTKRAIAHGEDNVFLLYLQVAGSSAISQDGRETVLHRATSRCSMRSAPSSAATSTANRSRLKSRIDR